MALDPVTNFGAVTVSTGYDALATSIVLFSGDGAKLPQPSTDGAFNVVWYNKTDYTNPTDDPNREICRVTARSTDTLTVTRAQEGTSSSTKNTAGKTYAMILTPTKKMIDDINTSLNARFVSAGVSGGQTATGGTSSGENLTLSSTSNATKGKVIIGASAYDEVNNRLGIGTTNPGGLLDLGGWTGKPSDLSTFGSSLTEVFAGNVGSGVGRFWQTSNANQGFIAWNTYFNGSNLKAMDTTSPAWMVNMNGAGSSQPDSYSVMRAPATAGNQSFTELFGFTTAGVRQTIPTAPNTSGTADCPTSSSTQTITHSLGRVPATITLDGIGRFVANGSATPTPFSHGKYTSSGNSCVYMDSSVTSTLNGARSNSYAIRLNWDSGNYITGVIQNITSTTFDIVWTETGTVSAMPFMWECQ